MRYRLVSFDLWFTLITDPTPGVARHDYRVEAFTRALTASGQEVSPERVSRVMREEWARYHRVHFEQWRTLTNRERVADMTARLGCQPLQEPLLAELDAELAESLFVSRPVLLPGMVDLLVEVASSATLVLISDTSYSPGLFLRRLLEEAGVLDLFAVTTFSDELGRAKPDPSVFEDTARASGCEGVSAVHIGDRELTDVKGARAAGWDALLFLGALPEKWRKAPKETDATAVVWSVDELREILVGGE